MLSAILRVHPSYLKRKIKKFGFTDTDYISYCNRHLYSQNSVVDFIVYLAKEKLYTDLHKSEQAAQKIK